MLRNAWRRNQRGLRHVRALGKQAGPGGAQGAESIWGRDERRQGWSFGRALSTANRQSAEGWKSERERCPRGLSGSEGMQKGP